MIGMRCPWHIAGPLLSLLIVGLRAAVNKPLSALGGYIDAVDSVKRELVVASGLLAGVALYQRLVSPLTVEPPTLSAQASVGV